MHREPTSANILLAGPVLKPEVRSYRTGPCLIWLPPCRLSAQSSQPPPLSVSLSMPTIACTHGVCSCLSSYDYVKLHNFPVSLLCLSADSVLSSPLALTPDERSVYCLSIKTLLREHLALEILGKKDASSSPHHSCDSHSHSRFSKCLFLASKYALAILKSTGSHFEGSCPSIAQLEERGTVKENTVRSQGHWFDPGSKDFLLVAAIFRREKRTGRYSCVYELC